MSGLPQLFYAGHNADMTQVRPRQLIMLAIATAVQKSRDQLQDEGCLDFVAPNEWCYAEVVVVCWGNCTAIYRRHTGSALFVSRCITVSPLSSAYFPSNGELSPLDTHL